MDAVKMLLVNKQAMLASALHAVLTPSSDSFQLSSDAFSEVNLRLVLFEGIN